MAEEKKKKTPEDFKRESMESFRVKPAEGTNIKKIIGVVSGKGGVGKSLVTGLSACAMNRKGYKTGVLDADITGPSIPKMFGADPLRYADENGNMIPAVSENGIKIMSVNLLMENDTDPVIWRGPVIAGVVKQFYGETNWGDIDYMFVDMPPGTGDVPLTVFQSLPVDGIIVVSTPQELVSMIVEKAVNMAALMNVPIIGLVENMSYMNCPHCNKPIYVFGESKLDTYAANKGMDVLAKIPLDPEFSKKCDAGKIEEYEPDFLDSLVYRLEQI
jgi:Mrp family chromosome partitioning ATPase